MRVCSRRGVSTIIFTTQYLKSDIAVECRYTGVHWCREIMVSLYRAGRYSRCRYIRPSTVQQINEEGYDVLFLTNIIRLCTTCVSVFIK